MAQILRVKDSYGNWIEIPAVIGPTGPSGQDGSIGPTGPTGPQGVPGTLPIYSNVTVPTNAWSADSTYASYGFNYRAFISIGGCLSTDTSIVVFGPNEQSSNNYAPWQDTVTDGLYIYAANLPSASIILETIILLR